MKEIIGYENNKPVYKDFGPAASKFNKGNSHRYRNKVKDKTKQLLGTIESLPAYKADRYLVRVKKTELENE